MTRQLDFDPELLRRYDRPGPRYTSYPTAPQFTPAFGEAQLRQHIQRSNAAGHALSIYAHMPFCASPCFYCGCNRVITRDTARGERYLERLLAEVALAAPLFERSREVLQVHLGGGTPNFFRPRQIGQFLGALAEQFQLSSRPERDFSIELDPRTVSPADIAELGSLGFNRASLGVQDFDPQVQRAVNRIQSVEETLAVVRGELDRLVAEMPAEARERAGGLRPVAPRAQVRRLQLRPRRRSHSSIHTDSVTIHGLR